MSDSVDVFTIGSFGRFFTIRWYAEAAFNGKHHWEYRRLGPGRFALDFYRLSLVFERYTY